MNSARFARFAVECRPRSGWAVDKELCSLESTLDSVLIVEMRAKILAVARLEM